MKNLKNVFFVFAFLVPAFFISSCTEPIVVPSYDVSFELYPFEYSDYHYFFDTVYKASFLDYYNNTTGVLTTQTVQNTVLSNDSTFEVWVFTGFNDTTDRYASAHIMLYEHPPGGYSDTLKTNAHVLGKKLSGRFRKLQPYEYVMHDEGGFIYLRYISDNYVGVTYKTNSGKLFGTPSSSVSSNDTLILKMIQWDSPSPSTTPLAWELKMKNVYLIPYEATNTGFALDVKYLSQGYQTHFPGYSNKSISTMLDIDRYTGTTRTPPPDGKFDLLSGYTINFQTNELIFPTLKPFYDNLVREGVDIQYLYQVLYTHTKWEAENVENAYNYMIAGKYTHP